MINSRLAAVAISMATVVSLAACSSSGSSGGGVSQSQLEAKLKKEPSITALTKSGGAKASAVDKFIGCAAKALEKDANQSDLKNYVDGKISIQKVKPKSTDAKNDASDLVKSCAGTSLSGG